MLTITVGGNVTAVAPAITSSSANQRYVNVATGAHVPGTAVNVPFDTADPVIVGVGAVVNTPAATASVASLVFAVVSYVANAPVTTTDITAS
jgi:hypothetical protein